MSSVELAVACFSEGFCCSQAVLSTFGPQFGLDRDAALRVSAAFAGGMGRLGDTCGAVTGAFMVIGLKYGTIDPADAQAKEMTYRLVREFVDKFKARNGSVVCRELLGYDISTPEGLEAARDKKRFATLCPKYVRDASEIVELLLI